MAGGHNDIDARLLAALRAFDGWYDMHPGETGAFDLVLPTDRVTGGSEDDLEVFLHVRVLFPYPDGRVYHDQRMLFKFCRHHNVYSEYPSFVFDQAIGTLQQLFQNGGHIILTFRFCRFHKSIVNPWLIVLVEKAAC